MRSIAFLLLLALPVASVFAGESPPKIYIDKGACPFECCTYRDWTVTADTALYDKPGSREIVDTARKGEIVKGVTGEVHLHPTPFTVAFEHGRFHVGDTAYLLTYKGEGIYKVWLDGAISEEPLYFINGWGLQDWGYKGGKRLTCAHPSAECWGRIGGDTRSDWWVLIRTPRGKQGWTKEYSHFGNQDACS